MDATTKLYLINDRMARFQAEAASERLVRRTSRPTSIVLPPVLARILQQRPAAS